MAATTKTADLPALATTRDITTTSTYKDVLKRHQEHLQPSKDTPVKFGDVACSPDGKNVAGIVTVYEDLKGRGSTRLAIINVNDGSITTFGNQSGTDSKPCWSPDGTTIAFLSQVDGLSQLRVLDLASENIKSTDKIPGNVEQLAWSIDGAKILLVVAGLEADLAGVDKGRASQGSERVSSECSWMPTIEATPTAEAYRTAWVHCIATGVSEQVTPAIINIWQAVWLSDTAILALCSDLPGEEHWYHASLCEISLQTGAVKHVFGSELPMEWLTTSPSGAFVAFAVGVASDRAILTGDLHILHVSTGKVSKIDTGGINVGAISWVGNDDLVASGLHDGRDVVFAYERSTNQIQELWSSEKLSVAGEGISQVSGYKDGDVRVAFVQQGWFTPPTLVVASSLGVRTIKAFASTEMQERVRKLGQAQTVKWKAPDGLETYGYYLHPPTQGPFPTIMHIHGGPVFGWRPRYLGLDMQLQVLLDAGFAVFEPNPRGSWGRGQSFAKTVYGDMGGVDTLDYLSGIDHLVDKGLADPSRLGVYGASYGGFMTAWLISQTDRFKAAIPTSPVTDWVSEHFTSNLARFCQDFLADDVHDFGGKYLSRSPIHHVRKTKTPTLLVCGALDKNTPPGQAVEFHHGLIEQGVPSVLLTYPEEGHGVRNIPARVDLIAREVEWFRRYM
ncbi:alpha beta-hydrolase [Fusarium tjaetaba]|uniref:Dipeptidyl-peptidase V n=1 Tax=Fusarium tjaetaba TaxID=1567544 RepID=A0A8H5SAB1_9HYPO|nr:alpha beta-hydrolase [Fusarium tjaetaba]KAF5647047.1 alpha beta-hydrolase [Fusarium tjaetaba]